MKLHGHDIEVGDKVWDNRHGGCEIIEIRNDHTYPIKTKFNSYMTNGKALECHAYTTLFWQPFDIPAHAYQKPKKLVEKGHVVYKHPSGKFECTSIKYTKSHFKVILPRYQFIRFVEETVEMVEE